MLEIIVISPEGDFPNELNWVIQLFEAGLSRYHLRKPEMNKVELADFLQRIPEQWRSRVILHQAHELVEPLGLGGWHFKDDAEQLKRAGRFREKRSVDQVLSRSIHSLDDLNEDLSCWTYVLLSPVFQSISKGDYGPGWKASQLTAAVRYCREVYHTKVFALGGVDAGHLDACNDMGFEGVALLGAIWQSPYPLESFLEAQEVLALLPSS